ncbi:MAG: PHP domain-containing protein [Candidatus Dadabacteria bacterium]|nr:MAG: PHP domain-containing protein [Candidatus Dadabacteria bacterium]
MVDLHTHSTFSDGTWPPRRLVEEARRLGLAAIGLTDHDSVDGNREFLEAGAEFGVAVFPGVEISTRWERVTFHLLGYGIDTRLPEVRCAFERLARSREERAPRMVARLRELGIAVTLEEVEAEANGALVGRPHVARVLVRKGVARDVQDAFARFLGRGKPAYVDKDRLPPGEACRMIRSAGGVPVLAHPGLIEAEHPGALGTLLDHLVRDGLEGVEAYYSRHSREQQERYRSMAARRGLLVTGGSDFHEPSPDGPRLGTGLGALETPDACAVALADRLRLRRPELAPYLEPLTR